MTQENIVSFHNLHLDISHTGQLSIDWLPVPSISFDILARINLLGMIFLLSETIPFLVYGSPWDKVSN